MLINKISIIKYGTTFFKINGGHGGLKLHEKIKLYYNDLPIKQVFNVHSITVVIKSLIEKNNKFYLELSINHCLHKL